MIPTDTPKCRAFGVPVQSRLNFLSIKVAIVSRASWLCGALGVSVVLVLVGLIGWTTRSSSQEAVDSSKPLVQPGVQPETISPQAFLAGLPIGRKAADADKVLANLSARLEKTPSDSALWAALGDALMQKARETADSAYYTHAERAYRVALSHSPHDKDGLIGMAWVAGSRHQFESSIEWAEQAIAKRPDDPNPYGLIGDAEMEIGNYDTAGIRYQKMLDIRPDQASYCRGAQWLFSTGDTKQALWLMRKAVEVGGLETVRLEYDFVASLLDLSNAPSRFQYLDDNYPSRAGWKEIIVLNSDGVALLASTVGTQDRSRALSNYPADKIPPQDVQASFTASLDTQSRGRVEQDSPQEPTASNTPRDAFTDVILNADVGVTAMGLGLAIAFIFGSLHALAPGHGKTIVAAYLAGSRGTAKHAVALGIVVTVTHTLGVFLLGFTVLSLNQFVVPETLYPWVGVASGVIIFCVGIWLLYFRVRRLILGPKRRPVPSANVPPAHHTHDLPEGPITVRAVLALGISGGLIPCPSALVVLLSAIAVHRLLYGLLLITAFSVGLASVLVVIGLFVVWAKDWIERIPRSYRFLRLLGFLSALVIIALGLNIVLHSLQTIVDF